MGDRIEIEDHREVWIPCLCLCVNCSHRWTAVVHESRMEKLECGDCGEMKGAVIEEYPVEVGDG
ncbi:MAG TPA: hypothetical protein VMW20_07315 [Candidatus Nanoarchaeia archaeon]|nr:hypothetical protein [Candidatus Nanoarchaeia archaeon]